LIWTLIIITDRPLILPTQNVSEHLLKTTDVRKVTLSK